MASWKSDEEKLWYGGPGKVKGEDGGPDEGSLGDGGTDKLKLEDWDPGEGKLGDEVLPLVLGKLENGELISGAKP